MRRGGDGLLRCRMAVVAVGLSVFVPSVASAQQIRIRSITPASIDFPAPLPADFDQGFVLFGQTVQVDVQAANRDWRLDVQAASATFDFGGKPASHLEWSLDGSTWFPVLPTPTPVLTSRRRQTVVLQFRIRLDWAADVPGTYSVPIVFSVQYL